MSKIRIYLADDHQILIDGLIAFLNEIENIEVVGSANDGVTLMREIPSRQPDMILLDLNMPRLDGIKTLQRLGKEYPQIKVLVLSNYQQSQIIKEARDCGAKGYLLKNGSKKELLEAITAVNNNELFFSTIGPVNNNEDLFADDFKKKYQLTKREIEIIQLVCDGLTTKDISEKLFITEFTVNTHRKNILRKLDVKNTAGVINFANAHGLT